MSDAAPHDRETPYVGPRPFERGDAARFFGRDAESREIVSLVISDRVVLLYAASGAGKTSILNAGVVPLLEDEGFDVLPVARLAGGLTASVLGRADNVYAAAVLAGWQAADDQTAAGSDVSLATFLKRRERRVDEDGLPSPRALIFDQFEELFTLYPAHWRQRAAYVQQIAQALADDPLLRVIIAIREDHLAGLDPYAELLPDDLRTRSRLERLGADEALSAVTGPLAASGRTYAPGVAEKLVRSLMTIRVGDGGGVSVDVEAQYVEPVHLQVTCQSLWTELPDEVTQITEEHLRSFGDVDQVLGEFYDDATGAAAAAGRVSERRVRRWIEDALITSVGTRGTVYRAAESTAGLPNKTIDELENRHLIRAEWRAGARWYELTHDRLIGPIRRSNLTYDRRRARRILVRTCVAGLLVAGAAVALIDTQTASVTKVSPEIYRQTKITVRTTLNVRRASLASLPYDTQTPESTRSFAPSARGNLVNVLTSVQGFPGQPLTLSVATHDRGTDHLLTGAQRQSTRVRFTATQDLRAFYFWLPVPDRGRYDYLVRLRTARAPLTRASSVPFGVTPGGSATPIRFTAPTRARCSAHALRPLAGFARVILWRRSSCHGRSVIIRDVSADPAPSRAEFTRFANFDGGLQDVDNTRFSLAVEPGSCVRLFDLKDYKGFATPLLCAGQRVARAWNLSTVGARASSMKVCHRRARRACQS